MSYKFLSTIQAISATFTGNSVYSNSTPNRTVKVDATGLYLSRISDGGYASTITADGSMYYNTRNNHIFQGDSSTKLTIVQASGNVLIGTTTDGSYKLDVNGTGRFTGTTNQITAYYDASNYMQLQHNSISVANTALLFNVNSAERMRLLSTGNLLIGTTTDAGYKLDVIGTIRSKDPGSNSNIVLTYGTGGWLQIFDTTPTETIRLRAGGGASYINTGQNVLIGTTTDAGYKLDVNGTGRFQNTLYLATTGTNASPVTALRITSSDNGNGARIEFNDSNVGIMRSSDQLQFREYTGGFNFIRTSNSNILFAISQTATNVYYGTLTTSGSITASTALARGVYFNNTLVAAANNDVLVGLDITPTFTNGAFTGLTNVDLRTKNAGVVVGSNYGYGANYGYTSDGIVQIQAGGTGILGSAFSTQMVFRPSGNAASYNSNYWSYIEQSSGGFLITSARYQNLYLRASTNSAASADLYLQAGSNTIMLLKGATSNVLIGTTTDAGYKLDVNGSIRAQNSLTVAAGGTVINATSGVIQLQKNGSDFIYINNDSYSVRLLGDQTTIATTLGVSIGSSVYSLVSNYSGYRGVNIRGGWNLNLSDTPVASAILQADSTTKGFLQPRMTTTQRNAIATPATGLSIYNTTTNTEDYYNGSTWVSLQTSITNPVTGTGTTNYVPKWTGSTALGNSLMYDNGTTLLVGTTTASTDYSSALLALSESSNYTYQEIRGSGQATLVLTQGVTANSTTPAVEIFNSYNFGIKFIGGTGGAFSNYPLYYYAGDGAGTGDYVMMQAGGSERLRIASNGNVQIGTTTNAGYKLDINGTARVTGAITTGITGTAGTLNLNRSSDGANVGFVRAESSGAGIQIGSGVNMFFSNNGRIVVNSTTTDASAIFKIDSSTQGFLPPRMTNAQRTAISTPAVGLIVYQTDSVEGVYVYTSGGWKSLTMV